MNNRKLLSIVGASAVAASVIAGGILTVSAQEPTATPQQNGAPANGDHGRPGSMGEKGQRPEGMGSRPEGMGGMGQHDSDSEHAEGEAHPEGMGMHGGKGGMKGAAAPAALADFLGVDVATLQAARQEGKSLATVAQEAGKTREELKTFLLSEAQAHLDEEVASGKHTQEEAGQKLAALSERVDALIDGTGPGMSPEGMRGSKMKDGGDH